MSAVLIGVAKEIKTGEGRVALTPAGARSLIAQGHGVLVERGAGRSSGSPDEAYSAAGAVVCDRESVWADSALMVKVKEPQPEEYRFLRPGLALFAYLHLAANPDLAAAISQSGVTALAYEEVRNASGGLPLLIPMSQIAGRLAVLAGAVHLTEPAGGPGRLISGALGVDCTKAVVIGAGVVGWNAARLAAAMGAEVYLLDVSGDRLQELEPLVPANVHLLYSSEAVLESLLPLADLVIGAVLIPGARAPRVLTRSMLKAMKEGTVFVDVAIDQGGCAETSKATTHASPTYTVDGVIHYCVPNMPGSVPVTATCALTNATRPYISTLALGVEAAMAADRGLAAALVSASSRATDFRD